MNKRLLLAAMGIVVWAAASAQPMAYPTRAVIAELPLMMVVNPQVPARSAAEFIALGAIPWASTPAQFGKLIADDRKRYSRIIKERGITLD